MREHQLMSKKEVARLVRVSVRTVERHTAEGRFPQPLRIGRTLVLWRRVEVLEFLGLIDAPARA